MRKSTIVAMSAAALCAVAFPAAAQLPEPPSGKIGFVNSERVMYESITTRKAKQDLEDKFQKRVKEIDAGPPDQIERRRIALDEDMNLEREDALRQFVERTNRIIRQIALDENFDAVFLEAAYFSTRIDLTDKVIKALDADR
jgi:outer membrane protein